MRFYRIEIKTDENCSGGFVWYRRKRDAERAIKGNECHYPEVETVDVVPTKKGIFEALRIYASHPDNG